MKRVFRDFDRIEAFVDAKPLIKVGPIGFWDGSSAASIGVREERKSEGYDLGIFFLSLKMSFSKP